MTTFILFVSVGLASAVNAPASEKSPADVDRPTAGLIAGEHVSAESAGSGGETAPAHDYDPSSVFALGAGAGASSGSSLGFVAPRGVVNETAGGLTNLGRGSARGPAFFDDFNAGQGFSGVYDEATGSVLAFPSGPGGVVPRRGGHAVVDQRLTQAIGAPEGQRAGFTAILQSDGSLQVQWLSRSVNGPATPHVPEALRPAILDALRATSGRTVAG